MPRFTRRFRVRRYELDFYHHVNNAVYVQYMEEAAIEASTAIGFSPDWYRDHEASWVMRRLTIRYQSSVTYGDEVEVATWVSEMGGVRCTREYDLRRVGDGAAVARARAVWIHIDRKTGQPLRLPRISPAPSVRTAWSKTSEFPCPRPVRRKRLTATTAGGGSSSTSWMQAGTSITPTICTGSARRTLMPCAQPAILSTQPAKQSGWPGKAAMTSSILPRPWTTTRSRSSGWVCEMAKVRGAWTHEVYHADSRKLLARDYSLGVFVNPQGKPAQLPAACH